ncbi:hypothetical protein [Pseudomonas amygdali]|uniref:hypothetical protein n=1 Tax=Pseudomonas amygdali TaxID=47877 RepID=UPI0011C4351C|nr:hypothetical protein [Pseudomonas amygdali]
MRRQSALAKLKLIGGDVPASLQIGITPRVATNNHVGYQSTVRLLSGYFEQRGKKGAQQSSK